MGQIVPETENPGYAFDERRNQYNSKLILSRLMRCPHESLVIIGITEIDLFIPILKYVYGLAQIEGLCALVSLHRLRPEFYEDPPNPDLFMGRAEKTLLHEMGHCLGLQHCVDRRCVMHASTKIADTDYKRSSYCPACFDLFHWYLQKHIEGDPV